ncbi:MAG: tetratricopeptide repeat protein, partial [Gammaproteobacteria bacterium]|nr:tetratricopeptide repeat protein [Gammaproteobacteria bacterium]
PAQPYNGEMNKELMYSLMLAELAVKRERYDVAVTHYLAAARYTREGDIAERATRVAFFARADKAALEAAQIWERAEPENPEIAQVLALLYLRDGQIDTSLAYWKRILNTPNHAPERIFHQMARVLGGETDKSAVLTLMHALMADYDGLPEAHLAYAKLAIEANRYALAQSELDKALKLKPGWWQVHVLRARAYTQQGDWSSAEKSLGDAVRARPDDSELRLRYARLLFERGKYKEARSQFKVLLKLRPKDADVRFALGILQVQLGELERAEAQFKYLISKGQRVDDASFYLGNLAERRGELEQARHWYGQVRRGENVYSAVRRLVFIISRQDGLDQALAYLSRLSSESASDAVRLLMLKGELLTEAGQYQRSFEHYSRALQEYPQTVDLLYSRAMVAERLGKLDVLESDLREIIRNDPDNADALNALGYTLADRTDRYKEALRLIKRALELKPNNGPIMDSMGWVLYKLGRNEDALKYLSRAYQILRDGEVAAHLGEVYWESGEKQKAEAVWNEALKNEPDNEVLKRTMEKYLP